MNKHPEFTQNLQMKTHKLRELLNQQKLNGMNVIGDDNSPVIHIQLQPSLGSITADIQIFQKIQKLLKENHNIMVAVPEYIPAEHFIQQPTLRLTVTTLHNEKDLEKVAKALKTVVMTSNQ